MLHRDMIEHVRKAFKAVFSQRKVISASDLKGEWLVSIYYEQPRWMGPEIAATLEKNIGKFYSVQEACDRMARLYAEATAGAASDGTQEGEVQGAPKEALADGADDADLDLYPDL